jgi:exodeoxyribonuclease VII small subunit
MPKRAAKEKEPSFEQALAELEKLVAAMEEDQLPLEKLVESYEQGSKLLARCEAVLESARERLEMITLEGQPGEPEPEPAAEDDAGEGPDQEDDEIRLF